MCPLEFVPVPSLLSEQQPRLCSFYPLFPLPLSLCQPCPYSFGSQSPLHFPTETLLGVPPLVMLPDHPDPGSIWCLSLVTSQPVPKLQKRLFTYLHVPSGEPNSQHPARDMLTAVVVTTGNRWNHPRALLV